MRNDVVEIRPFQPQDQTAVRDLIEAGLAEHWGVLDRSRNPDLDDIGRHYAEGTVLVACSGGEIVGCGALIQHEDGFAQIVRMSVAKESRRQGIGRLLLARLCQMARERGYDQVILETTSTWTNVIAFYLNNGFHITDEWGGDTYFRRDVSPSHDD